MKKILTVHSLLFFVLCVLPIFVLIVWASLSFKITTIECQTTTNEACTAQVSGYLQALQNQSLFYTSVESKITKDHTLFVPFQIADIQKKLPNTIRVTLNMKSPLYQLRSEQDPQFVVGITEDGIIIPSTIEDTSHITITATNPTDLIHEEYIDNQFHKDITETLTSLAKHTNDLQRITWKNQTEIELYLENKPKILIARPIPTSRLEQLYSILESEEVASQITSNSVLDLRFELPVLRTAQ